MIRGLLRDGASRGSGLCCRRGALLRRGVYLYDMAQIFAVTAVTQLSKYFCFNNNPYICPLKEALFVG
jgi:hypothetical protein